MTTLQQTILAKKAALAEIVAAPFARVAERVGDAWPDADAIDERLRESLSMLPNCQLLYAWDLNGIELSSMVRASGPDPSWRGRNLSDRPYLKNHLPFKGVMLSSVYVSKYTFEYCLTVLQAVRRDDQLLGFIAADFAVNDLLRDPRISVPNKVHWQQFRGDPSVRGTVFMQTRTPSVFDRYANESIFAAEALMRECGVFHSHVHFSSGHCSLWLLDDPHNYHLHDIEELINPEMRLVYRARPYAENAKTKEFDIIRVLEQFRALRFLDETIYLRSGSLNVMNGMVGLTFSCDGSHYMSVEDFLDRDLTFWIGAPAPMRQTITG